MQAEKTAETGNNVKMKPAFCRLHFAGVRLFVKLVLTASSCIKYFSAVKHTREAQDEDWLFLC